MRALQLTSFGEPECLELREVPTPALGPRDVLIGVAHCGICRHDILSRQGAFPTVELPVTPGHQISGHVMAVGADVAEDFLGRAVTTMLMVGCGRCGSCNEGDGARCAGRRSAFLGDDRDGGYADYVVVPFETVVELPENVDLRIAAVVNCTLATAYHAVVTRGQFRREHTVLVTGASGGVGTHVLKLLAYLGISAIAVTSRAERRERLAECGASEVILASDGEFAKAARQCTSGRGVDGVIEIVGAPTLYESLRASRDGGTVVVLGNVDGSATTLKPALLILRELAIVGTKSATRHELLTVLGLVTEGALDVEIAAEFPLDDGAAAHRLLEEGKLDGRALLTIDGSRVGSEARFNNR
jgi:D-arabinose 1-dehydrogenase-like Zn-dependent alcohol dehydrogenase